MIMIKVKQVVVIKKIMKQGMIIKIKEKYKVKGKIKVIVIVIIVITII